MTIAHKEENDEDDVENGEWFPEVGYVLGKPIAEGDGTVGDFEEHAIEDEVSVLMGVARDGDEHQGKHDEKGGWKSNVAEMVGRGNVYPLENGGWCEGEGDAQYSVVCGGDPE